MEGNIQMLVFPSIILNLQTAFPKKYILKIWIMKGTIATMIILLMSLDFQVFAQGDLMITPNRIIFEGSKQREEIYLVNIGKDTATYSISFIQFKMQPDGRLSKIDYPDLGQMIAEPFLRVFPHEVTLAPKEPQVIMLQFRRTSDMRIGEYHSHLYFRSEKDYKALSTQKEDKAKIISVHLIPVYGRAIPVIIRNGTISVSTSLNNLKLENKKDSIKSLQLTINRVGNSSSYGDIIVEYLPVQGKPIQIGKLAGIGVYTEVDRRTVSVSLNKVSGINFKKGNLRVRYTSPEDSKYMVFSEALLPISDQNGIVQQGATKDNNGQ